MCLTVCLNKWRVSIPRPPLFLSLMDYALYIFRKRPHLSDKRSDALTKKKKSENSEEMMDHRIEKN